MERVTNYGTLLKQLLKKYADTWNQPNSPIKHIVITDTEEGHFQLLQIGWEEKDYIFAVMMHFDIIDGKIWVQENRTEELVAEELVKQGVPKMDIVLGLQAPSMRKYTEYAVA